MKKLSKYKTQTVVVVTLVLSCQLLTGTGLFCTVPFRHLSHLLGRNRTVLAGTTVDPQDVFSSSSGNANSHNVTPPCNCKKHKKCPVIPRVALTSNLTYRLNEIQRDLTSQLCHTSVTDVMGHLFALRGNPPYLELAGDTPLSSSTTLLTTCVLLI